MQLRIARLCLDCEEVHAEQHCPVCASERFGYLSRWVPVEERRERPRERPRVEVKPEPANGRALRWATGGAAGIALVAISRWLLAKNRSTAKDASKSRSERPERPESA